MQWQAGGHIARQQDAGHRAERLTDILQDATIAGCQ